MLVLLKTIFGIFTISVNVAQRLEYLTGHQKATGCTHTRDVPDPDTGIR